jgi:predicted  nucleic acid-binding Zn-ribbon protein
MSATTAENLRDLHELHQRAKALRARLSSGPKTLAVRQTSLATRTAQVEQEHKTLQDAKVRLKKHEHSLQGIESKISDLTTKLNLVKKNDEYKALQNQIAHEESAKSKIEEEILTALEDVETHTAEFAKVETDAKRFGAEVVTLQQQIDDESVAQKAQLVELETAIVQAEDVIPEEYRVQYRRIVARYGPDALAACDEGSCLGCFTSLTAQMVNDIINGAGLSFCLSCGRLLYHAEKAVVTTARRKAAR